MPAVASVENLVHAIHVSGHELDLRWNGRFEVTPELADRCAQVALAVAANKSLISLTVGNSLVQQFPPVLSSALARGVGHSTTLNHFDLVCHPAPDDDGKDLAMAVAEALQRSVALQSCRFDLHNTQMDDEAGLLIAQALGSNKILKEFVLSAPGGMGNAAGQGLANALKTNAALRSWSFNAAFSQMDDRTGLCIAEALEQNKTVEAFAFRMAGSMGNATGMALALAVMGSVTLRSCKFKFECSTTDDETGLLMAEAVEHHVALEAFEFVASDHMGCATSAAVAEAIKHNKALQSIALEFSNAMRPQTGMAFADAMRHNTTLKSLTCSWGDSPGCAVSDLLQSTFAENVTLQELEFDEMGEHIAERNRILQEWACAIAALARPTDDVGFHSLVEKVFRRKVFRFFLPAQCGLMPISLAIGGSIGEERPCWTERGAAPL